jgi:DNA polymerase I-like protein with 3'-5' exonuclease and polymerase domains
MKHQLQGALFLPDCDWKPPKLSELPRWKEARRIAVDVETCDPQLRKLGPGVRRGAYIAGIAFAIEDGPGFYLPIQHLGGDNLDREKVLEYVRDQAAEFEGDICGANLGYDLDFLAEVGIEFPKVRWFRDVQVAEPLIDELQNQYNLDAIGKRYGFKGKSKNIMQEAAEAYGLKGNLGGNIHKLPGRFVAEYGIQDVHLPLQLLRKQERKIDDAGLWDIYNLESKVLPVLHRMRRRGVRIDFDRLEQIEKWSETEEKKALDIVAHHTNVRIAVGDVWKPEEFARALKEIGITPPMTNAKKPKPSITKEFLDSIDHPLAEALKRARQVNKVRSTFVESLRRYAIGDRIHCVMNQLRKEKDDGDLGGAAYGRVSSEHPNLQQQPARDPEIGPMWRSVYVPDEGGLWGCADYSQQEPRLLTHYAELAGCARAAQAAERYREDPNTDNHQMMADLTGLPRKQAKNIFLGLCYGMGQAKLAHEIGLPTDWIFSAKFGRMIEVAGKEAQAILKTFNNRAPYVKELARKLEAKAKERGYIITILGRHCHFPEDEHGNFDWTHKALNRLIQGGSADQTKAAMVAADAEGFPLQLQVHDELDLTVAVPEQLLDLAEIMRNVVKLNVPSKVDPEIGPNWGEIKELAA